MAKVLCEGDLTVGGCVQLSGVDEGEKKVQGVPKYLSSCCQADRVYRSCFGVYGLLLARR